MRQKSGGSAQAAAWPAEPSSGTVLPKEKNRAQISWHGEDHAMRKVGRMLQLLAMILLPLAMVLELSGNLARSFGVSDMVVMLVFGVALFLTGRVMEGYARA